MKLLVFFMLVGLMHVSATSSSQTITLKGKNIPFVEVLSAIRQQGGYAVAADKKLLRLARPVSVDALAMPLEEFLDLVLQAQPLEARISDKTIVLSRKPDAGPAVAWQDRIAVVRGLVSDTTGQPLPGVTIRVANTRIQTVSDQHGQFVLHDVPADAQIEVSMLGYVKQTVPVAAHMLIRLPQTEESIGEVVVTGLFERKQESFTGSTTTFTQKDLLEVGNLNVIKSLSNLDPSFRVMENLQMGSNPNTLPDIQLRGQTGLPDLNNEYGTNPNLPLFILDGFETDLQRIVDLDIYLVKSITLLKDASSKAVYGSRAANGVVVIETIRPPSGQLQITYNYNLNVELPDLSSYNLANAAQKLEIEMLTDPGLETQNGALFYTLTRRVEYNEKLKEILRGVDTYWLSQPLRNGYGQRHSVTLGGGRDELQYYVEMGYNDIRGVMEGSGRKIYTGGLQLVYRKNAVSVSNVLRLTSAKGDNSPYGSFADFAYQNPYLRARDEFGDFTFDNPMYNGTVGVRDFSTETNVINNTNIIWNIRTFLRLDGRIGLIRTNLEQDYFLPAAHNSFPRPGSGGYNPNTLRGSYTKSSGFQDRMNSTLTLNFNKTFTHNHAIYFNVGVDANAIATESYGFKVVGFPNANLDFPAAAIQYATDSRLNGTENRTRDMGFFTAVNYAYDDRYLADLSWRKIRSSQFGTDSPTAEFWSAGLGWNLHNEAFVRNTGLFSLLRITANTGYTGSQPLNAYLGRSVYQYQQDKLYYGQYSVVLMAMANHHLGAQRKQDHNISLNMGFLQNRFNVMADYYISNTDGLLIDINLPNSTGFSSFKANQGKVENKGVDLRLNYQLYRNVDRGDFISFYATAGHNSNRLKELSNTLIALTSSQDTIMSAALKQRFEVGRSVNTIWAVPSLGIDPATGKEVFLKKDGTATYDWDAKDQVAAGDAIAKIYGNLGFSVRFHGWQLNTSFGYNFGGDKYNQTLVDKVENIDPAGNVDARVFTSRWKEPGEQAFFKGINDLGTTYPTTRFVEDWNELTLSNINVSYDLDRLKAISNAGIRRLRASLMMDNAFVFSSIRMERGIAYPFARTFSFSIQTNF